MQVKKRGVSEVVTTVLIVVVSIAAVAILWAAVRPAITGAGDDLAATCLKLEVEPISCTYSDEAIPAIPAEGDNPAVPAEAGYVVIAKRIAGEGNVGTIKYVFETQDSSRQIIDRENDYVNGEFDILETTSNGFSEDELADTLNVAVNEDGDAVSFSVRIAAGVNSSVNSEKARICPESVKKVTCPAAE